jgi:hypothetical protein
LARDPEGDEEDEAVDAAIWVVLLSGIFAVVVAGLTYSYDRRLKALEQEREAILEADRDLRDRRLAAYESLWCLFNGIPLRRDACPTRHELDTLRKALVDWYYGPGGMLVTDMSRDALFRLRDHLRTLTSTMEKKERLEPDRYDDLFRVASALRTNLTADVSSRSEAELSKKDDRRIKADANAARAISLDRLDILLDQGSLTDREWMSLTRRLNGWEKAG